jgi:hypothetical protein
MGLIVDFSSCCSISVAERHGQSARSGMAAANSRHCHQELTVPFKSPTTGKTP